MKKHPSAKVTLSIETQKALFTDVCQRRTVEACGVLLGKIDERANWHVEQAYPLRNIFDSPNYFEFDPEELLSMELSYPEQIIGVYHSHPTGFPRASNTDSQNMQRVNHEQQIPWIWLIVSGPFNENFWARGYNNILTDSIIAYHHYGQKGLYLIDIKADTINTDATQIHEAN